MAEWNLPIEGGCRCGRTRFRATGKPLLTSACHCTGCQRMTASAFSLSVAFPSDGFEVTKGETVIGGLHDPAQRHQHCDWCKSWLFSEFGPDASFVNVRATMLDEHAAFEPFVEFWTSEKLAWATTPAKHSFATQPEMEAFPQLVAEFSKI
jgi:hypothetical protein